MSVLGKQSRTFSPLTKQTVKCSRLMLGHLTSIQNNILELLITRLYRPTGPESSNHERCLKYRLITVLLEKFSVSVCVTGLQISFIDCKIITTKY